MKIVGLLPVRNEDWVLELSLRALLRWVDAVIIYLHACSDRSGAIVEQVILENESGRLVVIHDGDSKWDEMRHRQQLIEAARHEGATHIVTLDADEILTGNLLCSIRDIVATIPNGYILHLPGYNLRGSTEQYHASGLWAGRWFTAAFPDDSRLGWRGDTFHQRQPSGMGLGPYTPIHHGQGGIMHLWGASERRLIAKHAAYKISERQRWPDKPLHEIDAMYSWAIRGGWQGEQPSSWAFSSVPDVWWAPYSELMGNLELDAEPWQEAEVAKALEAHPELAIGLDLFGLESLHTQAVA